MASTRSPIPAQDSSRPTGKTIASLLGCASPSNVRRENDAYDTPAWAVAALIRVEAQYWPKSIWDPCSGRGDLSRVLRAAKFNVVENDIVRGDDFLKTTRRCADAIVTNSPYKLATEFILHAAKLGVGYHAWLLKGDFLNAKRAFRLIEAIGYPARIWALTKRPDFLGQGAPTMNCSWFVFDGDRRRQAIFEEES